MFYSHVGWIFYKPTYERLELVDRKDLDNDPGERAQGLVSGDVNSDLVILVVRWQHRFYGKNCPPRLGQHAQSFGSSHRSVLWICFPHDYWEATVERSLGIICLGRPSLEVDECVGLGLKVGIALTCR